MYYKPDWEQAKERMLAWWDHEIIDRACVAVHAPKRGSDMPPFPNLTSGPWLGGNGHVPCRIDCSRRSKRSWFLDWACVVCGGTGWCSGRSGVRGTIAFDEAI